ncbi:MAG: endonuclease/exonuclease/phosphatase family protein [Clostridia bacterium]|nr:endonuclease/exonuclease/phosphatase family protein [Clostridia bacterium]
MKMNHAVSAFLLAVVLMMSGCGSSAGEDATPTSAETTLPVVEAAPAAIPLTEGGTALYPIVRAEEAGEEMISLVKAVNTRMREDIGFKFTLGTDWIKRNTVPDSSIPEILLGATNRPETMAVAGRIGCGGYAVAVEGQKIVVYGSDLAALKMAVDAFFDAVSETEAGELVLTLPEGGIMEAGEPSFFAGGTPDGFVIVADEKGQEAASALQAAIKKKYGLELAIRAPGDAPQAKEFLIGDCGRAESDAALEDISSVVAYRVMASGEKLALVGKSAYSLGQAVDYFVRTYVSGEYAAALHFPCEFNHLYAGLVGAEYVELTEGADIRIMSFNLLHEKWGDKLPLDGRSEIAGSLVLTYLPDVIGLQEVSEGWYGRLKPMLKEDYDFVNEKTAEGVTNYSAMAYNKNKVKLITSGCELFSKGNSGNMRLMNWAVFETIAAGERFAVINTHLDINRTDGSPKNAYRLVQAKEMGERVQELKAEFGCPVLITGDYNCNRNTEEYKLFVETGKVKDAQWDAQVRINSNYKTYHNAGEIAGLGDSSIDHITYTEGAEGLFYMNHIKAPICNASDHNPIMADFVLG